MWSNTDVALLLWSIIVMMGSGGMAYYILEKADRRDHPVATPVLLMALCAFAGFFGILQNLVRDVNSASITQVLNTVLIIAVPILIAIAWALYYDFGRLTASQSKAQAPETGPPSKEMVKKVTTSNVSATQEGSKVTSPRHLKAVN